VQFWPSTLCWKGGGFDAKIVDFSLPYKKYVLPWGRSGAKSESGFPGLQRANCRIGVTAIGRSILLRRIAAGHFAKNRIQI
jgi:hypothetical protein